MTPEEKLMYGSVEGSARRIDNLYGSVDGKGEPIQKIYGSVNGEAKLAYLNL